MTRAVEIRTDIATAADLRRQAKRELRRRTALRLLAVANALDGMSRVKAARAAGIERQALCDAVKRFNAEGLAGLVDRPPGRRPERLSEGEQAVLVHHVLRGARSRPGRARQLDLAGPVPLHRGPLRQDHAAPIDVAPGAPAGLVEAEDPPGSPATRRQGCGSLRKKGLRAALTSAAEAHPGQPIRLVFMDEARVGQKGRSGRRWWMRGQRPAGRCDGRFQSAYIFAAVEPETGSAFGLVLPHVSTDAMSLFLAQFAATLEPDTHAVVVLDGAGWHIAKDLRVPDTVTLVRLPAYSPDLNPVERIWLYLRERFLSARVFPDYEAILNACCTAWNALTAEPERVRSIANFKHIARVNA